MANANIFDELLDEEENIFDAVLEIEEAPPVNVPQLQLQRGQQEIFESIGAGPPELFPIPPTQPIEAEFLASQTGVSIEPAPVATRAAASFGPFLGGDVEQQARAALREQFGQDVEVRRGPDTGELEFKNPTTGQFQLFKNPRGDVAQFAGEGIVIAGDVAGTITGGTLAAPSGPGVAAGTTVGAIGGTFVAEIIRQTIGKGIGVNDQDFVGIVEDALVRSGIAGAANLGAEALFFLGKFVLNRLKGRVLTETPRELGLDNPEVRMVVDDVNAIIEGRLRLRPGQSGSDELRFLEEQFQRNTLLGQTKQFRESDLAQMSALEEFNARSSGAFLRGETDDLIAGETVQKSLQQRFTEPRLQRAEGIISRNVDEAARIEQSIPAADTVIIGSSIRGIAEAEQNALRKTFRGRFDKFKRDDIISDGTALREFADSVTARQERALFPGLQTENAKLVKRLRGLERSQQDEILDGLQVGAKQREQVRDVLDSDADIIARILSMGDETGATAAGGPGGTITLKQVQEGLEDVNEALRAKKTGLTSEGASTRVLERAKAALKAERQRLLKDKPEMLNEITQLELELRIAKDRVDRSIIGKIMTIRRGQFVIKDENLFKTIIKPGNRQEALRLADAVNGVAIGPRTATQIEAKQAIRQGIINLYREKVFIRDAPAGGPGLKVPDVRAHERFVRDYGDVIEPFLSKEEQKLISTVGGLSRILQKQIKQQKVIATKVNKLFSTRLGSRLDPEKIAPFLLDTTSTGKALRAKKLLQADPEAWQAVQAQVMNEIQERIMPAGVLSLKGIQDLLSRKGTKNIAVIFSPQYARDLNTLANALDLITKKSGLTGQVAPSPSILINIWRAAFAPPLTSRGRVLTAAEGGRRTAVINTLGEALLDESKLRAVISARNLKPGTKIVADTLSSVGALNLTFEEVE